MYSYESYKNSDYHHRRNAVNSILIWPEEYQAGHIDGAMNINYLSDTFANRMNEMDKQNVYLIYCQCGGRSSMAVEKMMALGFEQLYHYSGGYVDWKKE